MLKTIECVCRQCGKKKTIMADDNEKEIRIHSRVLGVTVHFKSQFVYDVAMYEMEHWKEHRREERLFNKKD